MGKKTESGLTVNCPECAKPLSLKGFQGHMRFKHGIVTANSKGVYENVKTEANDAARLFRLMDTLKECRKRKEDIEDMDEGPIFPLFWRDESVAAIRRGLELQEASIFEELKSLGFVETREDS